MQMHAFMHVQEGRKALMSSVWGRFFLPGAGTATGTRAAHAPWGTPPGAVDAADGTVGETAPRSVSRGGYGADGVHASRASLGDRMAAVQRGGTAAPADTAEPDSPRGGGVTSPAGDHSSGYAIWGTHEGRPVI